MALRRLSTSSIQTNGKSSKLWDQNTFQSGMFALATVTVPSGGALSVTFSGIPANYKHLQIRAIFRDNRSNSGLGSYAELTFNGDTTNNYSYHQLFGSGSGSGGAAANANYASIEVTRIADNASTANVFGANIIDILDYASTSKTKTVRGFGGYDSNGTGAVYLWSGLWFKAPEAITSLTIKDGGGTLFSQNSQFALYGIKAG